MIYQVVECCKSFFVLLYLFLNLCQFGGSPSLALSMSGTATIETPWLSSVRCFVSLRSRLYCLFLFCFVLFLWLGFFSTVFTRKRDLIQRTFMKQSHFQFNCQGNPIYLSQCAECRIAFIIVRDSQSDGHWPT